MNIRSIKQRIPAIATSDGAGVRLMRSLGQSQQLRLDPFLMLDEFFVTNPDDYIGGFPDHPHRGFETVTYMLEGQMLHRDHLGNEGYLRSGGAQWMTAGRGIIHSEMPQQSSGRLRGFQLWVNLPAREKMKPAAYQDIQAEQIPLLALPNGGQLKVIAGRVQQEGQDIAGPIQGLTTAPVFVDVRLPPKAEFSLPLATSHHAFVYVFEGQLDIAGETLPQQTAGLLADGDTLALTTGPEGAAFLLLAAKPLHEPIVQYGPFVMNTREEIEQALEDYRNGTLV